MNIEQQLRDFLKDLLNGIHSPKKALNKTAMLFFIKEHASDMGEIRCLKIRLSEKLEDYFGIAKRPLKLLQGRFIDYSGRYFIEDDFLLEYNNADSSNKKLNFIKEEDFDNLD